MNFCLTQSKLCGLVVFAMSLLVTDFADAQCSTCAAPTVAYQPVTYQAAQPVVAYRDRWYLGRALDRWRSRGLSRTVPTYSTVGYTPYTASYVPYTASYAPATYTAAYRPYTVGYASYYRPYVTSYAPLTPACTTCAQTVARPVVLQPSCGSCGCDPCSCASPCTSCASPCSTCASSCDSCSVSSVSQATYTQPSCSSCAASSTYTTPPSSTYSGTPSSAGPNVGQQTPQPQLEPTPGNSIYQSNRPEGAPTPEPAQYPGPEDTSTYHEMRAPKLLDPSDRTAFRTGSHGPTVDVWNAVYSKPEVRENTSQVSYQTRSQEEIDAQGWNAVAPGQ